MLYLIFPEVVTCIVDVATLSGEFAEARTIAEGSVAVGHRGFFCDKVICYLGLLFNPKSSRFSIVMRLT